jgi:hypothetical protein
MLPKGKLSYIDRCVYCICEGNNFKYYWFKGEVIILKCKDCGRFQEISDGHNSIQHWSNGTHIYFCPYNEEQPYYREEDDTINKYINVGFLYKQQIVDNTIREVGDIPKHIVLKRYIELEKRHTKRLKELKKLSQRL